MWYVMLGETETGPLTRVDVGVEAASGAINGETLVWREGMADWVPGAKVPELAQLFLKPPKSPRAPRPPPPPKAKPKEKGMGVSEFDTAHFRLADMGLSDRPQRSELSKGGDRLAVPKRILPKGAQAPVELDKPLPTPPPLELDLPQTKGPGAKSRSVLKQASTAAANPSAPAPAVKSVRASPAPKPAAPAKPSSKPAAPPAEEEAFDPNRTSVDFRTLGALVQKQQAAQSIFESELVPDEAPVVDPAPAADPKAEELSKWAAQQLKEDEKSQPDLAARLKAKALTKPPPPVPLGEPKGPSAWLYVGIAGGILAAIAFVAFLLWD